MMQRTTIRTPSQATPQVTSGPEESQFCALHLLQRLMTHHRRKRCASRLRRVQTGAMQQPPGTPRRPAAAMHSAPVGTSRIATAWPVCICQSSRQPAIGVAISSPRAPALLVVFCTVDHQCCAIAHRSSADMYTAISVRNDSTFTAGLRYSPSDTLHALVLQHQQGSWANLHISATQQVRSCIHMQGGCAREALQSALQQWRTRWPRHMLIEPAEQAVADASLLHSGAAFQFASRALVVRASSAGDIGAMPNRL